MELGPLTEHQLGLDHLYFAYTDLGAGSLSSSACGDHNNNRDLSSSFSFDHLSFDLGLDSPWPFTLDPKKETKEEDWYTRPQQQQEEELRACSSTPLPPPPPQEREGVIIGAGADGSGGVPPLLPSLLEEPRKPRRKRRKLDNEKEEVSYTPPSTPPYLVAQNGQARLDLTREELLALTSDQFEGLISQVRSSRDLTSSEKREIKKQRRLIKNRESAHASRQRKKDYLSELEKKLADMAKENRKLTEMINSVQSKNAFLSAQNQLLKRRSEPALIPQTIQKAVSYLDQQLQTHQISHEQSLQTEIFFQAVPTAQHKVQQRSKRNSGLLLMVLLFSFGVMFGNFGFPPSPDAAAPTEPLIGRAEDADILPCVYKREEWPSISYSSSDSEVPSDRKRRTDPLPVSKPSAAPLPPKSSGQCHSLIPQLNNLDASFYKPMTTYLICENIHKFDPPHVDLSYSSSSQKLSFLIPPSSLDVASTEDTERSLLVVSCDVTDVSFLPLSPSATIIQ